MQPVKLSFWLTHMDAKLPTVWPECDAQIAEAITAFLHSWEPYSAQSRRYSIFRLFKEKIDPAWQGLLARYPFLVNDVLPIAWFQHQIHRSRKVSVIGDDGNLLEILEKTQAPRISFEYLKKFNSLACIAQKYGFTTLEYFIYFTANTSSKHPESNKTLGAGLDSLRSLAHMCNIKKPKKITQGKINAQRGKKLCQFCDQATELTVFLFDKKWPTHDIDDERLRLSSLYCRKHKPKDTYSGAVRAEYLKAKRTEKIFNLELERLDRQSYGGTRAAYARSGNPAVDEYIRLFANHNCLTYEQTLNADELEVNLRSAARMLVDNHITDRKKEIIALLSSGHSQSEVSRQLRITRQAISKNLNSIPKYFLLTLA